jgi:hypothetical protein
MSMAAILARLDRLERHLRLDEPVDDAALTARLVERIGLIRSRLQAQSGWVAPTDAERVARRMPFGVRDEAA